MRFAAMLGLLLGVAAAAAGAEAPSAGDVAALAAELDEHPDEPAVARALARAHLARGDSAAAVALLRGFGERLPAQRPALAQLLGRALYLEGELDEARRALELALAHRPDDALAHLYLGLVLWRSGDPEGAARALRTAGELDPSLARPERPREAGVRRGGHFNFMGRTGIEFDTNPLIEGEDATSKEGDDFRLAYQAGAAAQLLRTETRAVSARYRFEGSKHDDLGQLDVMAHDLALSGVQTLGEGVFLRVDGAVGFQRVDHDAYLDTLRFGPVLGLRLGERGLVRLRASAERRDFEDDPGAADASFARDGWRYRAALSHTTTFERWPEARLTGQLTYARTLTHGRTDVNGFGAAYDSNLVAADAALSLPVALGFRMEARLLVGYERFDEENAVQFAADGERVRRRDTVVDTRLSLLRPLTDSLDLEVSVRDTRHGSTASVYDWDRQIGGAYLRFRFDP